LHSAAAPLTVAPNNSFKPKTNRYAIVFGLIQALGAMNSKWSAQDKQILASWLNDQSALLEEQGHFFSSWSHGDGGVGLVITADQRSGELHLMSDGSATFYVNGPSPSGESVILESGGGSASSLYDFECLYNRFRDVALGLAPNNSFKPKPLRGSA